ncbi:MAG: tetratricopeptide repeat protein, partial [Bacteroidota bacterium]
LQRNIMPLRLPFLLILMLAGLSCAKRPTTTASNASKSASSPVLSEIQRSQVQFYFFEGTAAKSIGQWDKAEQGFMRALSIDPSNATCAYEAARMALQSGDARRALEHSRKAVALNPLNPWFLKLLAQLEQNNALNQEAIKTLKYLTTFGEEHALEAWENMGMIHLQLQEYPKALQCYQEIEKIVGPQAEILEQKKTLYVLMNRKELAVKEMQRLIALYPDELTYKLSLVQMHSEWGQYAQALSLIEEALKGNGPGNLPKLYLAASELLYSLRQPEDAEKRFIDALETKGLGSEELLQGMFRMLERQGENQASREAWLRRALKAYPQVSLLYALLGESLMKQDRGQDAAEQYRMALSLPSVSVEYVIWQQYQSCLLNLQLMDSLEAVSRRALDLYPSQGANYFFLGISLQQNRKEDEAATTLRSGLTYIADQPELEAQFHIMLGDIEHRRANHAESDRCYGKALRLQPDNSLVLNNFAYYLSLRRENLDSALAMSLRATLEEPSNASYQDTYAWVLYQMGRYEQALAPIQKALQNSPTDNATLLEHYGDILFRLNRKEEAKTQWLKASESDPDNAALRDRVLHGLPLQP